MWNELQMQELPELIKSICFHLSHFNPFSLFYLSLIFNYFGILPQF